MIPDRLSRDFSDALFNVSFGDRSDIQKTQWTGSGRIYFHVWGASPLPTMSDQQGRDIEQK